MTNENRIFNPNPNVKVSDLDWGDNEPDTNWKDRNNKTVTKQSYQEYDGGWVEDGCGYLDDWENTPVPANFFNE